MKYPAGANSSSELAAVFVLFVVCGAGVTTRAALCGHRPRAGCLNANQAMPVQFRLTAPFFRYPQHGGRQLAQQSLQNLAGSGQHRDAVPLFKSRGSQVGRQRPHKPSMSGFDSRPRHQFHGPLDHSGGHSPRKRESTVQSRGGPPFQNRGKVENQRSLISSPIVVRLHVPQPSRGW